MFRFCIALTLFVSLSHAVYAAPAMRSDVCKVVGSVEDVAVREELYEPESWRKAWGLPKSNDYTDITLRYVRSELVEKGDQGGCDQASLPKVFQLRNDQKRPKIGQCIEATAQFSGDEFSIGHWLYDVAVLDDNECASGTVE